MDLLCELQAIPGPSGDEGRIARFLLERSRALPGVTARDVSDLIIAVKGEPKVAIFAHTDTVGFTQAYDCVLYPLGGPKVEGGERIREVDGPGEAEIRVRKKGDRPDWLLPKGVGKPGSRWVYADRLEVNEKKDRIRGPYLDNRAGVWNALRVLERVDDVAVFFTPNEEYSSRGALIGARLAYEEYGITQALISDITWHTKSIKNGKGPAISLRDRLAPRQAFLERVLTAAEASGIPFQYEVESAGGSDGHSLERSGYPVDWVFVGAPQKRSHTPREECSIKDLHAMTDLYVALIERLGSV